MRVCPRCNKSRNVGERIETKQGKSWLIEFCTSCKFNFELTEYLPEKDTKDASPKRENYWFKSGLLKRPDKDGK